MQDNPSEKETFSARMAEWIDDGLTGFALVAGDLSESTAESVYAEPNEIGAALDAGQFARIDWKGALDQGGRPAFLNP